MIFKGIFIILIACGCVEVTVGKICPSYNPSLHYPCENIFDIFHSCATSFLEISMEHSNPFTVCTNVTAYHRFTSMTTFYNLLTLTNDPKNNNVICSDEYLNKNQQSVILTILQTANNIWGSANCDDCYNGSNSEKQNFSDHKLEIDKLHEKYTNCTHQNKTDPVICHDCESPYMELNAKFEHEKKLRGGKICFDLEDLVNKTRQEWSGTFKCCKDKKDSLTAFYSLFSTVMVIAVVFYVGIYVSGSREDNLLDAQQVPANTSVPQPTPAPSSSSEAASSSQRMARGRKRKQKPKTNMLINEESDDDDPIIRPAPVSSNLIEIE